MNEVVVAKEELLKVLKQNRENHVRIYKDALEGVRVEYAKKLREELEKVENNQEVSSSVSVDMPVNHEEQYDEVIEMLEMSVEDKIELSRHEFQMYVQDKWVSDNEKSLLRAYALSSSNSRLYK